MQLKPLSIGEIFIVHPEIHRDGRGFFFESYNKQEFRSIGIKDNFVQDNLAGSKQGVLRGLHYQLHSPQGKLVRVLKGEIFDVCVDLRHQSQTFQQWVGYKLSAESREQLWIPPGFAHGYYALSEWAEVLYKVTSYYDPESEKTLLWNDPDLDIDWPLIGGNPPILSEKDKAGKELKNLELFQ